MDIRSDDDEHMHESGLPPLRESTEIPADPILGDLDENVELNSENVTEIYRKVWESYNNFQKSASEVALKQLSRPVPPTTEHASDSRFIVESLGDSGAIDGDSDNMIIDGPSYNGGPIEIIYCDDLTEKRRTPKVETEHVKLESLVDAGDHLPELMQRYIRDLCKEHPRYEVSVTSAP
jgi:hypothetical protein